MPTAAPLSPPGYLGYASGFSLSCMVFFLISVSTAPSRTAPFFTWFCSPKPRRLTWCPPPFPLLLPQPSQVIYKKFQIPCPLPDQGGNGTGSLNYTAASGGGHWDDSMGPQPPELGACTPSFFTLNSQVRVFGGCGGGVLAPGRAARALR